MRGTKQNLLQSLIDRLKKEGFSFIGDIKVDCKCDWSKNEGCKKCEPQKYG